MARALVRKLASSEQNAPFFVIPVECPDNVKSLSVSVVKNALRIMKITKIPVVGTFDRWFSMEETKNLCAFWDGTEEMLDSFGPIIFAIRRAEKEVSQQQHQ